MVTLLFIIAAIIFVILGIAVYYRQKTAPDQSEHALPPHPGGRGLFSNTDSTTEHEATQAMISATQRAKSLIERAKNGERSVLVDAHSTGDEDLYDLVLTELVQGTDSDLKLLALMSYVSQNQLPVNKKLARAVIVSWQQSPDRNGTAKALHFAALSDNVDIYHGAVETALKLWREEKLRDISPAELRTLFEGEFWILSSRSRNSGAGFVLKQTLANARRELEAAMRASQ